MGTCLINFLASRLYICFWKSLALTSVMLQFFFLFIFYIFFQSDSLIFGHICNKMFSSSQFAIFAICMIYILTKCLRWSFSKSQIGPRFCGKLFDMLFCRKLLTNFQGNCLILGHFSNKMFSWSQLAVLATCFILTLANCLILSPLKF